MQAAAAHSDSFWPLGRPGISFAARYLTFSVGSGLALAAHRNYNPRVSKSRASGAIKRALVKVSSLTYYKYGQKNNGQ